MNSPICFHPLNSNLTSSLLLGILTFTLMTLVIPLLQIFADAVNSLYWCNMFLAPHITAGTPLIFFLHLASHWTPKLIAYDWLSFWSWMYYFWHGSRVDVMFSEANSLTSLMSTLQQGFQSWSPIRLNQFICFPTLMTLTGLLNYAP